MSPAALRPASLEEALEHLAADPSILPVAGCTDLLVTDRLGRHGLERVLDLTAVEDLQGVRPGDDGGVTIGAATTFTALRQRTLIRERYPSLAEAAAVVGGWQIQNRATLAGNMVNASPAGDSLPVLLALEATVILGHAEGRREVPYPAFHTGYRETVLRPGELVIAVRLPPPPGRQAFRKVGTRAAQAISKVVVALAAEMDDGVITELRLAAGSVAATPVRFPEAEALARGKPPTPELARAVARAAARSVEPIDDVRSTAEYRRFALERVVRRMVGGLGGG